MGIYGESYQLETGTNNPIETVANPADIDYISEKISPYFESIQRISIGVQITAETTIKGETHSLQLFNRGRLKTKGTPTVSSLSGGASIYISNFNDGICRAEQQHLLNHLVWEREIIESETDARVRIKDISSLGLEGLTLLIYILNTRSQEKGTMLLENRQELGVIDKRGKNEWIELVSLMNERFGLSLNLNPPTELAYILENEIKSIDYSGYSTVIPNHLRTSGGLKTLGIIKTSKVFIPYHILESFIDNGIISFVNNIKSPLILVPQFLIYNAQKQLQREIKNLGPNCVWDNESVPLVNTDLGELKISSNALIAV